MYDSFSRIATWVCTETVAFSSQEVVFVHECVIPIACWKGHVCGKYLVILEDSTGNGMHHYPYTDLHLIF